jgi:hypothetical protein
MLPDVNEAKLARQAVGKIRPQAANKPLTKITPIKKDN